MMKIADLFLFTILLTSFVANAWLPPQAPIRGVNLGGLFVVEKWMMSDEWNRMGCGDFNDEWDCVQGIGQKTADAAFKRHWESWVTQDDINQIKGFGLNAIRIPLGFWLKEDLVQTDEFFPRGGLSYLDRVCKWAKDADLYVSLDLHGAPGGQVADHQFTGHSIDTPGFFSSENYERAYIFLEWLTRRKHTNKNYDSVGVIELVNEPVPKADSPAMRESLLHEFYPTAWKRIRGVEHELNISYEKRVHVQMMDKKWGQGDPKDGLRGFDLSSVIYDNHKYLRWDPGVRTTRHDYIDHSCNDDIGSDGDVPVLVGEWSLITREEDGPEFNIRRDDAVSWYKLWFAAQLQSYEKQKGWFYWTWKVNSIDGQNEWRWGYQQAVAAGVIPADLEEALRLNPCAAHGA